jgi:glycosyltransferase involved in cell wall biosynthesis
VRINIVVPALASDRFTGGIWCILQHAQQLALRGHAVTVIPLQPGPQPDWFPKPWRFHLSVNAPRGILRQGLAAVVLAILQKMVRRTQPDRSTQTRIRRAVGLPGTWLYPYATHGTRMGSAIEHLRHALPAADITLATDAETAWPVALVGLGQLAYFAQHYEPYFWQERLGGDASRREAELSYRLGLHQLANSPWLQERLHAMAPPASILMCPNAIDHTVFHGPVRARAPGEPLRLISYGGRDAVWKGFQEMCEALRLLRQRRPDLAFEWHVYGDALLPPINGVFTYKALGFLKPAELAQEYRQSHILLSASWYESFPLFPLEAMACGLAVITTQAGTELFARDGDTALITRARDPDSLAQAVARLADDEALRQQMAGRGQTCSQSFTWDRAGDVMEAALTEVLARTVPA